MQVIKPHKFGEGKGHYLGEMENGDEEEWGRATSLPNHGARSTRAAPRVRVGKKGERVESGWPEQMENGEEDERDRATSPPNHGARSIRAELPPSPPGARVRVGKKE